MTATKVERRRCVNCGRFLRAGVAGDHCDRCSTRRLEEMAAAAPPAHVAWPPPLPEEEQGAFLEPIGPPPRPLTLYAESGIVIPRPSQLHGGADAPELAPVSPPPAPASNGKGLRATASVATALPKAPRLPVISRPTIRRRQAEPIAPTVARRRGRTLRLPRLTPQVVLGLVIGILVGVVVPLLLTR